MENCTGSHRAAVPGSGWEEAGSKEKEGCEQEDSLPVIRRGVKLADQEEQKKEQDGSRS